MKNICAIDCECKLPRLHICGGWQWIIFKTEPMHWKWLISHHICIFFHIESKTKSMHVSFKRTKRHTSTISSFYCVNIWNIQLHKSYITFIQMSKNLHLFLCFFFFLLFFTIENWRRVRRRGFKSQAATFQMLLNIPLLLTSSSPISSLSDLLKQQETFSYSSLSLPHTHT